MDPSFMRGGLHQSIGAGATESEFERFHNRASRVATERILSPKSGSNPLPRHEGTLGVNHYASDPYHGLNYLVRQRVVSSCECPKCPPSLFPLCLKMPASGWISFLLHGLKL